MRSGSTWLYQVLRCHPDIRLSDRKEINFFFMREMLHHDLDWYEAHFEPGNGGKPKPVRGEISPLYARLKAWQVRRIADMLPDLRIILTLRHPIERVWSQALLEFGYLAHRDLSMIGYLAFLRQVERARNMLSSDYGRTIRIWSEAFSRDALHIDFFDRLRTDPEHYVDGVLRHIGARTPWAIPAKFMKTKVHATNSLAERLNELLKGKVSGWVDEMRTIRGKTRLSWRIMREVNRTMLSVPERLAYEAYHVILDVRLWWRWRQFQRLYVRDGTGAIHCTSSVLEGS